MPDTKITDLTSRNPAQSGDELPINRAGVDGKITAGSIAALALPVSLTSGVSGTLPVANGGTGITAFGTGVATALGVNVGSAGAFVTLNGALGTPSSGTLTNCTGLPIAGISATGTPGSGNYLRGDGTWAAVSGSGDVVGPASATDNAIARFDSTTGKLIQNSAMTIDDNGCLLLPYNTTNPNDGVRLGNWFGSGAIFVGSTIAFTFNATTFNCDSGVGVRWNSDTGLIRVAAGIVGVRDGSTGGGALAFVEQTAPSAPATNGVYVYAEDNGSGKTRLMARFPTGAAQQIAIEP